ncbi:putative cell division cycle 25C [Monocercomonoides exilis]|uniref:putative cell division cycle 25C n=1 Tax=Monocercomonoides exilis TaxID=2049356 RepID=UPI003559D29A|nr:putative cell division cycle 25C [Monocercomonoides exilis]|eukprot:MONOS_5650.1-p1 / transcript=MONOS_5650.1 / gene=MONOS_5650 / organism=Monocercomonoides_exilis_PA203 / gene_product=cell division cycle 25C / transcript_product=cell division cycle 25C / location=Mono_scaffold00167:22136-23365(-) / protein_length=302 / sequence_SO=supercontig / SO=protein_coding / is_pseudo=false
MDPESQYAPKLPSFADESVWFITSETLISVLLGEYSEYNYLIIDCRFPYEYDAGHIVNAINIYREDQLEEVFLEHPSKNGDKTILIFHCEFSRQRGPLMATILRTADRSMNVYPSLYYPQVFVLQGGYHDFFCQYRKFTPFFVPEAVHVSMFDARFQKECMMYDKKRPHKRAKRTRGNSEERTSSTSSDLDIDLERSEDKADVNEEKPKYRRRTGAFRVRKMLVEPIPSQRCLVPSSFSCLSSPTIFSPTCIPSSIQSLSTPNPSPSLESLSADTKPTSFYSPPPSTSKAFALMTPSPPQHS